MWLMCHKVAVGVGLGSRRRPRPVTLPEALGRTLQRLRQENHLSQEDLAFRSGVDRAFISRIERGRKQPTVTTLARLADGFGLQGSHLLAAAERLLEDPPD